MRIKGRSEVVKRLAVGSVLFMAAYSWWLCNQPRVSPPDPMVVKIHTVLLAADQLAVLFLVRPMYLKWAARKRPYHYNDLVILLAFLVHGACLGLVVSAVAHQFVYFLAFAFPCLIWMLLLPVPPDAIDE